MKFIVILIISLFLTSCATTTPGKKLDVKSSFLGATLATQGDFSTETIKMYQISIQNYSNLWIEIESTSVSGAKDAQILLGDKINSWIEACTIEKKVYDHNMNLLLGTLAVSGAVVGATSSRPSTSAVGFAVAAGSIGVAGARDFIESKNKAEFQETLPEGHIMRSFTIPPKKVVQKWILVENPKQENLTFVLKSKTPGIGEATFVIEK